MKRIVITSLKIIAYILFVAAAVYYTPRLLSKALHTQYPIATITSGSMWPALKSNDLVLMKGATGSDVSVGQIIIFQNPKGFTIHRLIRKENGKLVTKGDANNVEDTPILEKDVIGRVVYIKNSPLRLPWLGVIARGLGPKIIELEKKL